MTFINNGFNNVDKFFSSLNNYLNYNSILVVALCLFVVAFLVVLITTSNSYESKLIRAIDMFNNYFMKEPQITAENLLDFNNKMKSNRVPKQLKKQWQQFVLYRDKSASEYMSFEVCVSSPIKNSTYKRDVKIFNYVSYILALISFIVNIYYSMFESSNLSVVLQHTLLCPILIIILNLLITIFFDIKHNTIVNDLNQNYQYFEVNIDKATTTIPEYVDYELLFDKNEIKKGIPVLYTYLQRRQEEEKKELDRARLKNVEHEKFNFDEAGVAKSLVLERAMQEAENYIAERNKFLQDTEQINSDITQEEMNFREITKEYQREMQVSKETFDNFKAQLNDVSSSIEANYLKKQQQQELDRQRNLERDYDTATERHNQMMKSLQADLDDVNEQLKQARTSLEKGMMSEFDSYSQKVYADAERVVKERSQNENARQKSEIDELKAKLNSLSELNKNLMNNQPVEAAASETETVAPVSENTQTETSYSTFSEEPYTSYPYSSSAQENQNYSSAAEDYSAENEQTAPVNVVNNDYSSADKAFSPKEVLSSADFDEEDEEAEHEKPENRPSDLFDFEPVVTEDHATQETKTNSTNKEGSITKSGKKRGRPRKPVSTEVKPKRPVGRPRKVKDEAELNKPKRGRGRPRKIIIIQEEGDENNDAEATLPTKKAGANKAKDVSVISVTDHENIADIDDYLKEIDDQIAEENAKMEASQKELEKNSRIRKRKIK